MIALVNRDDERGFACILVDHQRVAEHLKVNISARGIECGQSFADIALDLQLVVLSLFEPEEAFRLRAHMVYDLVRSERIVALDDNSANRDPAAFGDVERESNPAVRLGNNGRLDTGLVISLFFVEGIDRGPRRRNISGVVRPAGNQSDLATHGPLRHVGRAAQVPSDHERPLDDSEL